MRKRVRVFMPEKCTSTGIPVGRLSTFKFCHNSVAQKDTLPTFTSLFSFAQLFERGTCPDNYLHRMEKHNVSVYSLTGPQINRPKYATRTTKRPADSEATDKRAARIYSLNRPPRQITGPDYLANKRGSITGYQHPFKPFTDTCRCLRNCPAAT